MVRRDARASPGLAFVERLCRASPSRDTDANGASESTAVPLMDLVCAAKSATNAAVGARRPIARCSTKHEHMRVRHRSDRAVRVCQQLSRTTAWQ